MRSAMTGGESDFLEASASHVPARGHGHGHGHWSCHPSDSTVAGI